MALTITHPADQSLVVGDQILIDWFVSGSSDSVGSITGDGLNTITEGLAFGNGVYVAVGYNTNKVFYSTNGVNWNTVTVDFTREWASIAYGNGVFIIIAWNTSKYMRSTDGVNWTYHDFPSVRFYHDIEFGDGKFVVVGHGGYSSWYYSEDGLTWSTMTIGLSGNTYHKLKYDAGRFVVTQYANNDQIGTSTDGINWTSITLPISVNGQGLTYGNGYWVIATADKKILKSTDLASWSYITNPASTSNFAEIAYGDGKFVAIYQGTASIISVYPSSADFSTYTNVSIPTANTYNHLEFLNGVFVIVSGNSDDTPIYGKCIVGEIEKDSVTTSNYLSPTGEFLVDIPSAQTTDTGVYSISVTSGAETVSDSVEINVTSLQINSPADQNLLETDPLLIEWQASGGLRETIRGTGKNWDVSDWVGVGTVPTVTATLNTGNGGNNSYIENYSISRVFSWQGCSGNTIPLTLPMMSSGYTAWYPAMYHTDGTKLWEAYCYAGKLYLAGGTTQSRLAENSVTLPSWDYWTYGIMYLEWSCTDSDVTISVKLINATTNEEVDFSRTFAVTNITKIRGIRYYTSINGYPVYELAMYARDGLHDAPTYSASIKKGATEIATETNTTGTFSYSKASAEIGDAGTYEITVTNNGNDISDNVTINVIGLHRRRLTLIT